jgi:hypothetical protein
MSFAPRGLVIPYHAIALRRGPIDPDDRLAP